MERPGGAPSRGGPKGKILDLTPSVPLRIVTAAGSPNYYVKVVDWETHAAKLAFFVRSGEVATLEIPLGVYELRYAAGETWYGKDNTYDCNRGRQLQATNGNRPWPDESGRVHRATSTAPPLPGGTEAQPAWARRRLHIVSRLAIEYRVRGTHVDLAAVHDQDACQLQPRDVVPAPCWRCQFCPGANNSSCQPKALVTREDQRRPTSGFLRALVCACFSDQTERWIVVREHAQALDQKGLK